MFIEEKMAFYAWNNSVPFKPVHSGKNRASKAELGQIVDYILPRLEQVGT